MLPGMYAAVRFQINRPPSLLIPSDGFRHTAKGPMVAVLQKGDTVHLQPVELGRDYGAQIEVLKGLKAGQRVITNWSDDVKEGVGVKPISAPKSKSQRSGGSIK
jgi:multidrug efflux pump subunit AcrA (membrane-fusion protein)